jgi:S-methylmethionine-dependent homocysteine/selenocysteine methylase
MLASDSRLPQLSGLPFATDGGMETTLIFHQGLELPLFASFPLLASQSGQQILREYYTRYLDIARQAGYGFIFESPTWRANRDWAAPLGYNEARLAELNLVAILFMKELSEPWLQEQRPGVVSGCLGPRADGYTPGDKMPIDAARDYHAWQIHSFAQAGADMVSALTMNYVEEAAGITQAAQDLDMPVAISFTVETDGKLPDGNTLQSAIEQVDAITGAGPAYYMLNCMHPDHLQGALQHGSAWSRRIKGIRANASRMSHAELNEAEQLDEGDPAEFGRLYQQLRSQFPDITVIGGCCGTDHRHVAYACGVPI